jgi:hypothetical protein
MSTGKTLFAQLMDYLPWSTFDRIVARYDGNREVRTLPCASQYQAMSSDDLPKIDHYSGGQTPPCPLSKPHLRLRIGMEGVREVEGSRFDMTAGRS